MNPSRSTQAEGPGSESAHSGGSKDVRGAIGISPKVRLATWQSGFPKGATLLGTAIPKLYQR